jgi:hypothetical protein
LLNQGTIYASLVRLQQHGWIAAKWGTSDNNRKAKFYSITRCGRDQLAEDAAYWQRLSDVMGRVLAMPPAGAGEAPLMSAVRRAFEQARAGAFIFPQAASRRRARR